MKDTQIENTIDKVKDVLNQLKRCSDCVFSNENCTWCQCLNKEIKSYSYGTGCKHYMTNEDAVRKLAEEQYRQDEVTATRRFFDMDIISYLIEASSQSLEKLDKELLEDHKRAMKAADAKANNNEREKKFKKKQDNRKKLMDGFAEMKYHAQNFRSAYEKYVVHFFNTLFEDKDGYDFKEHQKVSSNAGVINLVVREFCDKSLDNADNANAMLQFMHGLKGSGIYDDYQKEKYLIKK